MHENLVRDFNKLKNINSDLKKKAENLVLKAGLASLYQETENSHRVLDHYTELLIQTFKEHGYLKNTSNASLVFKHYLEKLDSTTIESQLSFSIYGSKKSIFNLAEHAKSYLSNLETGIITDLQNSSIEEQDKENTILEIKSVFELRSDNIKEKNKKTFTFVEKGGQLTGATYLILVLAAILSWLNNPSDPYTQLFICLSLLSFVGLLVISNYSAQLSKSGFNTILDVDELIKIANGTKIEPKETKKKIKIKKEQNNNNLLQISHNEQSNLLDTSYNTNNESKVENNASDHPHPRTKKERPDKKQKTLTAKATKFFGKITQAITIFQPPQVPTSWQSAKGMTKLNTTGFFLFNRGQTKIITEYKTVIALDPKITELQTNILNRYKEVIKKGSFYPGAAEGKNCIHHLNNNVWSVKIADLDWRILGTVIAHNPNDPTQQLIYFWQVLTHSELDRKQVTSNSYKEFLKEGALTRIQASQNPQQAQTNAGITNNNNNYAPG